MNHAIKHKSSAWRAKLVLDVLVVLLRDYQLSTVLFSLSSKSIYDRNTMLMLHRAEAPASTPKRRRVDTPSSLYTTDSAARHHEWQSFGSQRSPTKRVKRSSRGKNPEPSARKVAREATRVLNSFENTDEDHGGTYKYAFTHDHYTLTLLSGTKIAEAITKAIARNKNRGKDSISARTLAKILQSVASRAPSYEATEEASPQPDPMDEVLPQAEPIEEADEVVNRSVHSNRDSLEALNKSFQTAGKKVTALNGSMHLLWDSVESMNREFRANAESLAALNVSVDY